MKKIFILSAFLLLTLLIIPKTGYAVVIFGDGPLGHYTGNFTYSAVDASNATLTMALTNTSPAANGGFLDAFVFNNPGNFINGVSLPASETVFSVMGGPNYNDNAVKGVPYGYFDIGASTNGDFEGGGSPSGGIIPGATKTFIFTLTGSSLTTIDENRFISELSTGRGAGEGYQPFVVRFRGFNNGESDKVPGNLIPEPASLLLFGIGMLGFNLVRKRRRK